MVYWGNWFRIFIILLILPSCSAKFMGNDRVYKKNKNNLRIVTYNINWGKSTWLITSPQKTADAIKLLDGDIVLLQEATLFWKNYFQEHLSELYPYQLFKPKDDGGGLAVLTKYPVSNQEYTHSAVGWHPGWIFDVASPYGLVQIANLHLTPPLISKDNLNFNLSAYFSTPGIREQEMEFYYQFLRPSIPTVIAGDFNEGDHGLVTQFLNQHGFTDVQFKQGRKKSTWRWSFGLFTVQQQLDHIFYDHSFVETNAQVYYAGDSDHFPLAVDLKRVT
ncbi:endonuclease/exonuclease/phosphatase family protein [Legionella bononiensis]|uniref:Endonuclease/exonuclease/phosphatase family protein n=1 Tax=Legionella bononiensis TaxID=2793102 RepID=A0ABS1WF32_9GAMM|nr:endonuclease/exonuclease/phosphatase family protein [Legionella bononiensis]MBL7479308.1 endonuclease/exonuclease/phosphatase family protein [Legionella bononiensis]MBL7527964.1 endonuclease/exonuclease/phosphatase family protein [Legionella bononiensis]MBL7563959.1 endonuclease/exonuclease/phosphatase family protein [Legionella bononiensis]